MNLGLTKTSKTMKKQKQNFLLILMGLVITISCTRKKVEEPKPEEPVVPNPPELITTFKVQFRDTLTGSSTREYSYMDIDGDGGNPGAFGGTNQSDSVITLQAGHAYWCKILLLDQSSGKSDTISNEIIENESQDHLFFYNGNPANAGNHKGNTVLNSSVPYTVKTNGSNIHIKYLDLDKGSPAQNIGLSSKWYNLTTTSGQKYPIEFALKHQPGSKNGTYAPGETDLELVFKVIIQ